ncbi:hypothetical protein DICVIV_06432 [Dictyocaulus viviparus]|uniref:Uncharacterized protein n=1 Tax=Dictyocaulus viviparus TaxID=29172 RepID=A0A0D8XUQ4_DICVI|nr:hypothetical protein DICVIV_06432 [Dictyocaulus viviparus]
MVRGRFDSLENAGLYFSSTPAYTIKDDSVERIPLCEQHSPLALYEEDYDTQGQKISQMLRKLSVYTATEPTSEEADEKPKTNFMKLKTKMF